MPQEGKQHWPGQCDHCLGPIPPGQWYTSKGTLRLCCSIECKNAMISRRYAAPANSQRQRDLVAAGEWKNPHLVHPPLPSEQARRARLGRLSEIAAGTWRNPGLTPAAREINSQPHIHTGPLAAAIEKLRHGKMTDLDPEERAAYLKYRQDLRIKKTP